MRPEAILDWIEKHPVLVDAAKGAIVVAVAWFAGLSSFFRRFRRRPKASVTEIASRCYLETVKLKDGTEGIRASFLISVNVTNPTSEKIVVQGMELQHATRPFPWSRSIEFDPTALPSRPRLELPTATKVSRTWFIHYEDGLDRLTADGRLQPMEMDEAFVLFVSSAYGTATPRIDGEQVRIWLQVKLTSGDILRTSTLVKATTDLDSFEKRVPGVRKHVESHTSWNISQREHRRVLRGKRPQASKDLAES